MWCLTSAGKSDLYRLTRRLIRRTAFPGRPTKLITRHDCVTARLITVSAVSKPALLVAPGPIAVGAVIATWAALAESRGLGLVVWWRVAVAR
jgi:hypothetical protein